MKLNTTNNLDEYFSFSKVPLTEENYMQERMQYTTVQSGELNDAVEFPGLEATEQTIQQNVTFHDEEAPQTNTLAPNSDTSHLYDEDKRADLGEFLSRPVKIHSFTWSESDTFSTSPILIHPWSLFFNNSFIKPKIQNFSRLSCKLRLTFRFNASPFYYGLMRVAYDPLNTNRLAPIGVEDMIPISQAPGVWIEPQKTTTVEMVLPFVWPHNWLDVGSNAQFVNIGKIMFSIFSPLRSANGVTGSGITIATYASAEDVQIAGPSTATVLQAGVISGPATSVAGIARMISKAPVIGPFARAVDIGATAVSGIARLFGYSNAPVVSDVQPMHPKSFHAMANVETSMPIDKLSIDPENSVTIDNSVAGCTSADPLVVSDLINHISYFGQTDWSGSDSEGTLLFSVATTPGLVNWVNGPSTSTIMRMTPLAWVSQMFKYWRGSIKFTIKLVKSPYHKGRLVVYWDPETRPAYGSEAALFTQVIDLSTEQDEFEIDIPYKAVQPWLKVNAKSDGFGVRSNAVIDQTVSNGYLGIYVQNILTGPAASPLVSVLVNVQGNKDLQFSVPMNLRPCVSMTTIQSGNVDGSSPEETNSKIALITVGETIASLRTLLHRASLSYTQPIGMPYVDASTLLPRGYIMNANFFPRLPLSYGFGARGIGWAQKQLSTGSARFNYSTTHPINWVLMAFVGYRGSTNVHANVTGFSTTQKLCNFSAERLHFGYDLHPNLQNVNRMSHWVDATSPLVSVSACQTDGYGNFPFKALGQTGVSLTNQHTQSALSVNIPQYAPWRFMPAWAPYRDFVPLDNDRTVGLLADDNVRIDSVLNTEATVDSTNWPVLDLYYSAGVDFQPLWFVGIPKIYIYGPLTADTSYEPNVGT